MTRAASFLVLLPLVAFLAGCGLVPTLRVTPRYGPMELDGDFGVSSLGAVVTSSSDALGLDEEEWAPQGRADLDWGPARFTLSGLDVTFEGEGTAESQLDLGGVVITAGTPVASELDLVLATSAVTWDFVPTGLVDVGLGVGYGLVDYDANIASLATGDAIRSRETFGIPLAAGRARVAFHRFAVDLWLAGLQAEASGDSVEILDADLSASFEFGSLALVSGSLVVGYRFTQVAAEYDTGGSEVDADLDLSGPYFGLTLEL